VTLTATETLAEIDFNGLRNKTIRNRIKDLFMGDDEVHWYLRMYHPDDVITGENCRVVHAEKARA
jgi:predicted RNA-binding protein with PUA-like domain